MTGAASGEEWLTELQLFRSKWPAAGPRMVQRKDHVEKLGAFQTYGEIRSKESAKLSASDLGRSLES